MNIFISVVFLCFVATSQLVAQEAIFRSEAVGVSKPTGEPQPGDDDEAHAKAIRLIVAEWVGKDPNATPAVKRAVDRALTVMSITALRNLLTGPEQVVQQRRRVGYVEVRIQAEVNTDAASQWFKSLTTDHPLKKLRLMVVIPEYHIQSPIPDPAGETEIIRSFLLEGFRLVDQKQVASIRDKDYVKRALKNDPKELVAIAQAWGADLILVGEAFSQEVNADRAVTGNSAACRARIEARMIQCDTGEILTVGDSEAGAIDLSPAVAAKAAIREAAKKLADKMIDDLLVKRTANQSRQRIRVILTGADFEQKLAFEDILKSKKDTISDVEEVSFHESRFELDVTSDASASDIAKLVFLSAKKSGLNLKVVEQSNRRCVFEIVPNK